MGIEFYLCNHKNATIFELGRGPFSFSRYQTTPEIVDLIQNTNSFIKFLNAEWGEYCESLSGDTAHYNGPEELKYFRDIALELQKFIGGTDPKFLEIIHDSGDDHTYSLDLKYKCTGSRYYLGDEKEYKNNLKRYNHYVNKERNWKYIRPDEIKDLKKRGWNLKNVL
jgi:hypothetical protein